MTSIKAAIKLEKNGDLDGAEKAFRKIIAEHPDDEDAFFNLGYLLQSQRRYSEAADCYKRALELNPRDARSQNNLGNSLLDLGKPEEAAGCFQRALDLNPNYAYAQNNLGNALRRLGRPDEAILACRKALKLDPKYLNAQLTLGRTQRDTGDLVAARKSLEKATKIDPKSIRVLLDLGAVLLDLNRPSDAVVRYQRAAEIAPSRADIHNLLGIALKKTGANVDATKSYRRAIELSPSYAAAYHNLGVSLSILGKTKEAISNFEKALELDPKHALARVELQKLRARQIPQWHFTMLADRARNEAFERAIEKAVRPGSLVLDIGTGAGLLSLMAARAGAEQVTTVEASSSIAEVASDIIRANGYEDRVKLLNRMSTDLVVGQDLERRADVVVTEIFDAVLIGEGVLPTMRHAIRHLVAPDAKIIPKGGAVRGLLLEMPTLHEVYPIGKIRGFDFSRFNRFRDPNRNRNTELLTEDHRRLTDVFTLEEFDFSRPPPVATLQNPASRVIELKTSAPGTVHALCFWFDLFLDDDITVSSGPDGELKHWKQSIRFLEGGKAVSWGDHIKLNIKRTDTKYYFELS